MPHLTHGELIEYRQRVAKLNQLQDDFNEAQIKMRRWILGIGSKYSLSGLRYELNIDNGEIMLREDKPGHELHDTVNAVAMLDLEEKEDS